MPKYMVIAWEKAIKTGTYRELMPIIASERFAKAIEEIDKTIDHLQKTKENLLKTDDNLRLANNKVEDLSIKKITRNNPTMQKMFEELNNKKAETIEE
jgi:hypothetical protein